MPVDGALEESAGCGHIAARRQKEVHRLAESVNGALQILPLNWLRVSVGTKSSMANVEQQLRSWMPLAQASDAAK